MTVSPLIAPSDVPTNLFIGGSWCPASDGRLLDVHDPATGALLSQVANASPDDARDAVAAAADSLPRWSSRPPRERSEILRSAYEAMTARIDEFAGLIVAENGKSMTDAVGEVRYAAEFFRWFAEEAVRVSGELMTSPSGASRILVLRQPVGVSVLITPWNFPAAMATRKIAPALAAGCTVILKPAPETPLTALAIARLFEELGAGEAVSVLPSDRSADVVAAMVSDPRVRKLSFTGSTDVGKKLLHLCADSVVHASMELGGNAPFLVFADADLDAAVEGAMLAKMRNGGEACTAANRLYVERPVAEEFSRRLADAMRRLKVGAGHETGVDVGPLISTDAVEKVHTLVTDAVAHGAEVLVGGRQINRPGWFYEPTVLTGVTTSARMVHEEIFGPVAPVITFDDEAEVITAANATTYGLVSYVYTSDLGRGLAMAEALETGMVGLNRGIVSDPAAPFGGMKESGLGREGGREGILEFLETKYISTTW